MHQLLDVHLPTLSAVMARVQASTSYPSRPATSIQTRTVGSVRIIEVSDVLEKRPSMIGEFLGWTSTDEIETQLRRAMADGSITSVVLNCNSPGGSSSSWGDMANYIRESRSTKQIVAVVDELCCSAAYGIASACSEIIVSESATIGSIGTFAVLWDRSEANTRDGLRFELVSSAELKASGYPEVPLSDAAIADTKRLVSDHAALFKSRVVAGRPQIKSIVNEVSTGQAWLGRDSIRLRLADRIGTLSDVLSELNGKPTSTSKGSKSMSSQSSALEQWNQLVDSFCRQGMSRAAATVAANRANPALRERVVSEATRGTTPPAESSPSSDDAREKWEKLVNDEMAAGKTYSQAIVAVNRRCPELREKFVTSYNSSRAR